MYGGYIDIGDSKNLYYFHVKALKEPEQAPLVLWLNGAPGCSSLIGAFKENGPFLFYNTAKKISTLNEWTFAQKANVLYVDAPGAAGFSDYPDVADLDNDKVADDLFKFLDKFLNLFPEYAKNPMFLAGEGHAGMILPILGMKLVEAAKKDERFVLRGESLESLDLFAHHQSLLI